MFKIKQNYTRSAHCLAQRKESMFSSVAQLCLTLCNPMNCSTRGLPVYHQLRFRSIKSVMPSSRLILCRPLLLLPPIPPSIKVFSNESNLCMRWPKYWSFSFSIIPSKEIPGLSSFRMDWLDLRAFQGTLKSLLQHHSSKAWILQCSAFFIAQLSIEVNHLEPCLVHSKYCVYKTPNTVWLKWQNVFSHGLGSYKSEIKG